MNILDSTLFNPSATSIDTSSGTKLSLPPVITSVSVCISPNHDLASKGTTKRPPSA